MLLSFSGDCLAHDSIGDFLFLIETKKYNSTELINFQTHY